MPAFELWPLASDVTSVLQLPYLKLIGSFTLAGLFNGVL